MKRARSAELTVAHRRPLLERPPAAVPGLLFAALVLVAALFVVHPEVLRGELVDTDSYLHVVRLRSFVADWDWHGGLFPRDNAPYGLVSSWSKAYDLLFLALAAPLAPFAGWESAVAWVAPAIGPLAVAALILAGIWAAAPICESGERRLAGIVLAFAPMLVYDGSVGDADHHVMVVAAWLLFMGFALRVAMGGGPRQGLWAGLAGAFALWISVECILGLMLGIALMGVAWIRAGGPLRLGSLAFAATFSLATAGGLAFDPPYGGWLQAEAGRISILYVAFGGLLALLFAALAVAPQNPLAWRARLAVASAGAALCALCLAALFPGVLAPEHAVFGGDNELRFWDEAGDMQPAFLHPATGILFIGSPAIGLAVAVILAWRERREAAGALWAVLTFMLGLLSALALRHVRFALYPEALAALPIAVMLTRIEPIIERVSWASVRHVGQVLASVAIFAGPMFLAGMLQAATPEKEADDAQCPVRPVASALNDPRFMGGSDLIIMTHPTQAAEVLYWTGHRVVDAPFHTNVEGIYGITHDLIQFMTSRDDVAARAIVARRGIAFVMLCGAEGAIPDKEDPERRALFTRLLSGKVPPWLVAQPWPPGVVSDLQLFRVVSRGGPK